MAWSPQHFKPERRDVTNMDFDALAGEWGEELITLPGGIRAMTVKEPSTVCSPFDPDLDVKGEPGDFILDARQRMCRWFLPAAEFTEFAGGESV